jgi:hypothetical protein
MGREGGIDRGNHVVLVLLVGVSVLHAVRVGGLHVCLHGEQRAVGRQLGAVWNVHAPKVASTSSGIMAVDNVTVGQDVSKGAFGAKLAVALYYY